MKIRLRCLDDFGVNRRGKTIGFHMFSLPDHFPTAQNKDVYRFVAESHPGTLDPRA